MYLILETFLSLPMYCYVIFYMLYEFPNFLIGFKNKSRRVYTYAFFGLVLFLYLLQFLKIFDIDKLKFNGLLIIGLPYVVDLIYYFKNKNKSK
jgi:hypothetical protein